MSDGKREVGTLADKPTLLLVPNEPGNEHGHHTFSYGTYVHFNGFQKYRYELGFGHPLSKTGKKNHGIFMPSGNWHAEVKAHVTAGDPESRQLNLTSPGDVNVTFHLPGPE